MSIDNKKVEKCVKAFWRAVSESKPTIIERRLVLQKLISQHNSDCETEAQKLHCYP